MVRLHLFLCLLLGASMLTMPIYGIKSQSFYTWKAQDVKPLWTSVQPGATSGVFLASGWNMANKEIELTRYTQSSAGVITSDWIKSITCDTNKCEGAALFMLPGSNKEYVYTGWVRGTDTLVYLAKIEYATGTVNKVVGINVTDYKDFGICPLDTKFVVATEGSNGGINAFVVDANLDVETQFSPVGGVYDASSCSPIAGSDTYYITNVSATGIVNLLKMNANSQVEAEYAITGLTTAPKNLQVINKNNMIVLYTYDEAANSISENFKFIFINGSNYSLGAAKQLSYSLTQAADAVSLNKEGTKLAFTTGNIETPTGARTIVINTNSYALESSFETVVSGTNTVFVGLTAEFDTQNANLLHLGGGYYVKAAAGGSDTTDGAVQSIDLAGCGNGFKDVSQTLSNVDGIEVKAVSTATGLWSTTTVTLSASGANGAFATPHDWAIADASSKLSTDKQCTATDTDGASMMWFTFTSVAFAWLLTFFQIAKDILRK